MENTLKQKLQRSTRNRQYNFLKKITESEETKNKNNSEKKKIRPHYMTSHQNTQGNTLMRSSSSNNS